ncbi:deaminase [Nocardia thailandica]|uniref:Deaminase n=1 Tax=Nocardia thailandica TaxID=257275 RepID=A0ABW6PU60_9NOCA
MSADTDRTHLVRAVELAGQAGDAGNRPFGAVVVDADGAVVAEGENTVAATGDPTRHAELAAVAAATAAGEIARLAGSTVYASGEPCPMCAAAMVWAGVARIVFAVSAAEFGAILPPDGPLFALTCAEVAGSAGVPIEVEGPVGVPGALAVFEEYAARR